MLAPLAVLFYLQYLPLAGAVILVTVSFISLAYMLGSLLSNEQLKAWARLELTEAFYSAIIIALAFSIFALADTSIESFLNSPGVHPGPPICTKLHAYPEYDDYPCHIAVAKNFFSTVFDQSSTYLYSILRQYSRFSLLASVGMNWETIEHSMGSVSFTPFAPYLQIPMAIYSYLFDFGVRSLILLKMQEILLGFINGSVFPVFFVAGAVLRAFPAMRRLGGLMMATAVSLYYVFPAFYVLGSAVFTGMILATPTGEVMEAPDIDFSALNMPYQDPVVTTGPNGVSMEYTDTQGTTYTRTQQELSSGQLLTLDQSENICKPPAEKDSGFDVLGEWTYFVGLMAKLLAAPVSGVAWGDQFDEWVFGGNGIVMGMGRMVFFSLFFSFLAVMSTIAAIKSLSPLFGGDVEIAGLTHLV